MDRRTVRPAKMIFSSQDVKHAGSLSQVTIEDHLNSGWLFKPSTAKHTMWLQVCIRNNYRKNSVMEPAQLASWLFHLLPYNLWGASERAEGLWGRWTETSLWKLLQRHLGCGKLNSYASFGSKFCQRLSWLCIQMYFTYIPIPISFPYLLEPFPFVSVL